MTDRPYLTTIAEDSGVGLITLNTSDERVIDVVYDDKIDEWLVSGDVQTPEQFDDRNRALIHALSALDVIDAPAVDEQ